MSAHPRAFTRESDYSIRPHPSAIIHQPSICLNMSKTAFPSRHPSFPLVDSAKLGIKKQRRKQSSIAVEFLKVLRSV